MRRIGFALLTLALAGCSGDDAATGPGNGGNPGSGGGSSGNGGNGTGGGGGSGNYGGAAGSRFVPGDCGLDSPAFCETFETPHPGGRGGDLDEGVWSFSRWAHLVQYFWYRLPAHTYPEKLFPSTFCGAPFEGLLPGQDVRACDGVGVDGTTSKQLNEVFDDQGDFAFHDMRIRQPFDFTDRTGTIVWDVDAKLNPYNAGHGWWVEMWITEDPAPMPYHEAPVVTAIPRRGVGLTFRFGANNCEDTADSWGNALESVVVTSDYQILHWYDDAGWETADERCFKTTDGKLNHFELRISKDQLELWASDYQDPASFKKRATVTDLELPFTSGYVHFQHAHYNASKDGMEGCEEGVPGTCPTPSQTFRWDNIGFDGPAYATPRGYDVAESGEPGPEGGVYTGWYLDDGQPKTFDVQGVDTSGAKRAWFAFNLLADPDNVLEYRFNGGEWHSFTVPVGEPGLRSFALDAPLSELVSGKNQIEVRLPNPGESNGIGNLDITIEAN